MKAVARATIDFETRSSAELTEVGAFKYAQHWDTQALCLAYHIPGSTSKLWHPGLPAPHDLFFWIEDGGMVEAHNAEFEYCIWNYVQTRHGWPALPWKQLICSAAKAAAMGLPRKLGPVADVLNTAVRKDKDGHKIMMRVSRLKRPTKRDAEHWDDDPEKIKKLYEYCLDDIGAEMGVSEALPDLPPLEQKMWRHVEIVNERGVYCDLESCHKAMTFAKQYELELLGELRKVTGGLVKTARQNAKMLAYLKDHGVELENVQAKTVQTALELPNLSYQAKRTLEIRSLLNKSSLSKFSAMISMAGKDRRIRGTILFNGASTGRDTGRGIQPQNYIYDKTGKSNPENIIYALNGLDYEDFRAMYPNVFQSLSYILRGMLRAAPGKKFVAADFAAIETRVLFWIANNVLGLEAFHNKEDIYVSMAKAIYDLNEDGWAALPKETQKEYRQLGKQAILGLGYGMGAKKFVITCKGYGIHITEEFAKKVIKLYRNMHWSVPALWKDVERAAIAAVQRPGKVFSAGKCRFYMKNRCLVVELPSKRKLYYWDPIVSEQQTDWGPQERLGYYAPNSQSKRWQYEESYGGKMVENLVQAIAADLMREGSLRQEIRGYPTVIRVHDELIAEVDEDRDCLEEFEELMSELPPWATGCPVTAEGWEGPRYRK